MLFFFLLGGSEEKEPGEDQHKEADASGSKEGQTQSSVQDGNPIPVVLTRNFEEYTFLRILELEMAISALLIADWFFFSSLIVLCYSLW